MSAGWFAGSGSWKFSDGLIFSMQRRCSKKLPNLSCSDFAPELNSILQHQAGSNESTVPCSGFMEHFLEFQAWEGSLCMSGCAQPQIIHKSQRNTSKERNCHPLLPSFLCLLPILVTLSYRMWERFFFLYFKTHWEQYLGLNPSCLCLLNTLKYRKQLLSWWRFSVSLMLWRWWVTSWTATHPAGLFLTRKTETTMTF